ncbi:MAG: cupin domain-containing protein [Thermodesulfobacteriota bacterium]|nr:cupin domain-containing protein [Thermodesulfobacteriota bacterium]
MGSGIVDEDRLRKIIHQVLATQPQFQTDRLEKRVDGRSGVISVCTPEVKPKPFATGKDGDEVYLTDLFSLEESPRLGCGIMEMKASCFDWVLNYDEIDYVIEGRLEIIVNGKKIVGEAGDTILIPKNTAIQFSVPDFARFLYVTYPANWEEQQ